MAHRATERAGDRLPGGALGAAHPRPSARLHPPPGDRGPGPAGVMNQRRQADQGRTTMDKVEINITLTDAVLELAEIEEAEERLDARRKEILALVERTRSGRLTQR